MLLNSSVNKLLLGQEYRDRLLRTTSPFWKKSEDMPLETLLHLVNLIILRITMVVRRIGLSPSLLWLRFCM